MDVHPIKIHTNRFWPIPTWHWPYPGASTSTLRPESRRSGLSSSNDSAYGAVPSQWGSPRDPWDPAIYGTSNMDPIKIPQMLAYIPYITSTMDPIGIYIFLQSRQQPSTPRLRSRTESTRHEGSWQTRRTRNPSSPPWTCKWPAAWPCLAIWSICWHQANYSAQMTCRLVFTNWFNVWWVRQFKDVYHIWKTLEPHQHVLVCFVYLVTSLIMSIGLSWSVGG